jgi:hypothetical protein
MQPDNSILRGGLQEEQRARVLAEPGRQYAVYVFGGTQATLLMDLPKGEYVAEWLNPVTGKIDRREEITHAGGVVELASPTYPEDIVLGIVQRPAGGR